MARCGCSAGCTCLVVGGAGVEVTGVGSEQNPYEIAMQPTNLPLPKDIPLGHTLQITSPDTAVWVPSSSISGYYSVNVKSPLFGAKGDGTTDDTAAIQNAVAAAAAIGGDAVVVFPFGNYKITGTISCANPIDGPHATLTYTGSGVALSVGTYTSGTTVARRRYNLPRVVKPTQQWDGTSVAVRLVNLNTCEVHVPFVQNFEMGLLCYGLGTGFAYNTIRLGALWQNHKNLVLDTDGGTGYCNQNLYLGGRLQQVISGVGAVDEDTTSNQIVLGLTTNAAPNNNTFINTSVEGDNPAYYRLDVHGRYNKWINCRWENYSTVSRVRWNADATYNQIEHGYGADELVETIVAGAVGNEIKDRFGSYIDASNTSAMSIPVDAGSAYLTITGWTNDSKRAPYAAVNGSWTPRMGRWRISATVTVNSTSGTAIVARLLVAGARVVDIDSIPPPSGSVAVLKLSCNEQFSGTESLVVQVRQDTANVRTLSATAGFVNIHAEWVGP